jgi:hypothetical protein
MKLNSLILAKTPRSFQLSQLATAISMVICSSGVYAQVANLPCKGIDRLNLYTGNSLIQVSILV